MVSLYTVIVAIALCVCVCVCGKDFTLSHAHSCPLDGAFLFIWHNELLDSTACLMVEVSHDVEADVDIKLRSVMLTRSECVKLSMVALPL